MSAVVCAVVRRVQSFTQAMAQMQPLTKAAAEPMERLTRLITGPEPLRKERDPRVEAKQQPRGGSDP
jgi:hypothetical protein